MKILDGRELADYIKERQAKQVRALRQAWNVFPKLALVVANDSQVIDTFVRLKHSYGEDILVEVTVHKVEQSVVPELIQELNGDDSVHAIVLQLPLINTAETDKLVNLIAPHKDVDGLGANSHYVSATATSIDWLLAGYNVTLRDRIIAIVGNGRLVGAPLAKLWLNGGLNVSVYDSSTPDLKTALRNADIIVTATGTPGLIQSSMISPGKVVVDAGTASEDGVIVGDISAEVRERQDITITPEKGGVGPLTITALFDNVITAARKTAEG
ncbi:MAG: bifunctional 5,10-methylenetetrahydrofolate dehydrogenase/5,10-methenyltetrahydrofolate cyclohydrolase [Candidatus Microsaccharimonas sp.]